MTFHQSIYRLSKDAIFKIALICITLILAINLLADTSTSNQQGRCIKTNSAESTLGSCGPHGTCLIDRCICDPSYQGKHCQDEVQHVKPACMKKRDQNYPDKCMNIQHRNNEWGRLMVSSMTRYNSAQNCETSFWEEHAVPTRNEDQTLAFDQWDPLPADLGHVVEFGAGPYTKLRLILQDGRSARIVKSVTLIDPLVSEYIRNPKITTTYQKGNVCIPKSNGWSGGCIQTYLASFGGEDPLPKEQYDTVIMVNTIEHCSDAVKVFDNIYRALKPGGTFIFGEEYSLPNALEENNQCHPIRITKDFYHDYLTTFYGNFLMKPKDGKDIVGDMKVQGARHSIYAIAQKPH